MAQFADFLHIPTEQIDNSGYANLFRNIMNGYKMAAQPKAIQEDMKQKQLQNQLMEGQLSPENRDLEKRYKEAQISSLTASPQAKMTADEQLWADYQNAPEGTPEKGFYEALVKNKQAPKGGITVYDSEGNPSVQIGGNAISPTKLKTGEREYYKTNEETGEPILDKSGNKIPEGILTPTTPEQELEITGRNIFNEIYPKVNNIASYYSGKDSWSKFKSDLDNINTDSEAKARIVDYYTAQKLLPALTVKEQATLKASNTLGMFRGLMDKMNSSDIPKALESYAGFVMPSDIMQQSGDNMSKILTDVTSNAAKNVPAYQKRPFNSSKEESSQKMYKGPDGKLYTESQMLEMTSGGK